MRIKRLKSLIGLALTAALVLLTPTAWAGTITGSAHDFSASNWSGGRICVACHAPHKTDTTVSDAPLWHHAMTTATYVLYSSATLKATMSQPGGNSKMCLSCHDGTIAVDSFGGTTGTTMISSQGNIGTDLKKSHPIGFTYDSALATTNGSLHDPDSKVVTVGTAPQTKTGSIKSVLLFNGKMECGSCHDVHNTFTVGSSGSGLVKITQAGSKLCLECHNK